MLAHGFQFDGELRISKALIFSAMMRQRLMVRVFSFTVLSRGLSVIFNYEITI